jgi:hypothetical protein
MVKMTTIDQLFISAVSSETMAPGAEFDVSEAEADRLEKAGLAKRAGGAKAEKAAPANKMEAAPANKAKARQKGK